MVASCSETKQVGRKYRRTVWKNEWDSLFAESFSRNSRLQRQLLPRLRKFIESRSLELYSLKYRQASNRKHDECTCVTREGEKKKWKLISNRMKERRKTPGGIMHFGGLRNEIYFRSETGKRTVPFSRYSNRIWLLRWSFLRKMCEFYRKFSRRE